MSFKITPELIEVVARAIYEYNDEDYKAMTGREKDMWCVHPNIYVESVYDGVLATHEKDDYRHMARAAIKAIIAHEARKQKKETDR